MATDIIYAGRVSEIGGAKAEGDNLWLSNADLTSASGWELKPEGACIGDVCIPIPPAHAPEFVRDSGREFNLAALARHLGQPVVHDDKNGVWYFGEAAVDATRYSRLARSARFRAARSRWQAASPLRLSRQEGAPRRMGLLVRMPP